MMRVEHFTEFPDHLARRRSGRLLIATGALGSAVLIPLIVLILLAPVTCGCSPSLRYVTITCTPDPLIGGYRCELAAADNGVDFTRMGAIVETNSGARIGNWSEPIGLAEGGKSPVENPSSPLSGSSSISDNGDGRFGVGDTFVLVAEAGRSLKGSSVSVWGGGGHGSAELD